MIRRLWYDESGLTTVEYALVLAIVALAAFAVFTLLGMKVNGSASDSAGAMPSMN